MIVHTNDVRAEGRLAQVVRHRGGSGRVVRWGQLASRTSTIRQLRGQVTRLDEVRNGQREGGIVRSAGKRGTGIDDDFDDAALDPRWTSVAIGGGVNDVSGSVLRMSLPVGRAGAYSDAQIDD